MCLEDEPQARRKGMDLKMKVTYVVIVSIFTYILGAITKIKFDVIPNKYISLQNVVIGVLSSLFCDFTKVEPNFLQSFVLCMLVTMALLLMLYI